MVWALREFSACRTTCVCGMAGVLDSARFRHFLSTEFASLEGRDRLRAGRPRRHDGAAHPLLRPWRASRCPICEDGLDHAEKLDGIVQRTRDGGAEIVGLLKTGSAFYAPAATAIEMAEAFLKDQKRVLPCAAYLTASTASGHVRGRAHRDRRGGIEKVVEITLDGQEQAMFQKSVDAVKGLVEACRGIDATLAA
jgi:malate dehydrogenase